ncbi:MAG TPA: C2H2-type zinc finger protein [Anaerolineales bacterium]|nr:C2H2-type zinc finger protein [Anaerolineales bacterium]
MTQNKYQCEECDAVFYTREDLEKHNRTIHSRFTCDICGESFDSENELEAHNQVMHPEIQKSDKS